MEVRKSNPLKRQLSLRLGAYSKTERPSRVHSRISWLSRNIGYLRKMVAVGEEFWAMLGSTVSSSEKSPKLQRNTVGIRGQLSMKLCSPSL